MMQVYAFDNCRYGDDAGIVFQLGAVLEQGQQALFYF